MKMGKPKGSKKWSKEVRKENRPYHGSSDRTNEYQLIPASSQPKGAEGLMADSPEDRGDGPASHSQSSWAQQNTIPMASQEGGIAPLPVEDLGAMVGALPESCASGDFVDGGVLFPAVSSSTSRTLSASGSSSRGTFLVTPANPARPISVVPLAPRVLGNSQRENCPQSSPPDPDPEPAASSFMGLLTPPRKYDLQHNRPVPGGPDYFALVPDEVVLHIFYFLTRRNLAKCMRVCKKWYRVGLDELFWRRIDLSQKTIRTKILRQLLSRGTTHLRLAKSTITGHLLQHLNRSFIGDPNLCRLQYLDMSMSEISENTLGDILLHCRLLKKVSLEHLTVSETILHLLSENPGLETVNLSMCRGVTCSGLVPLFAHCLRLTDLNLAWTGMDRTCIAYVCGAVPDSIQYLNISGCRDAICDADVDRLCKRCHSLLELDLSDCLSLTGSTVETIYTCLGSLEELSLSRCYRIVPASIRELGQMSSLKRLNVFGMLSFEPLANLQSALSKIKLNTTWTSTIARPTTGIRRSSIWGLRVREEADH